MKKGKRVGEGYHFEIVIASATDALSLFASVCVGCRPGSGIIIPTSIVFGRSGERGQAVFGAPITRRPIATRCSGQRLTSYTAG